LTVGLLSSIFAGAQRRIAIVEKLMLIIAAKTGQLGNRLILSSHVFGFASAHGLRAANPAFGEYARYFQGPSGDALCRWPGQTSLLHGAKCNSFIFFWISWFCRICNRLGLRRNRFWAIVDWHDDFEFDMRDLKFVELAKKTPLVFLRAFRFRDYENSLRHGSAIYRYFAPSAEIERKAEAIHARAPGGGYRDWPPRTPRGLS